MQANIICISTCNYDIINAQLKEHSEANNKNVFGIDEEYQINEGWMELKDNNINVGILG